MDKHQLGYIPPPWQIIDGKGPVIATAIHNGHFIPFEEQGGVALSPLERLREEDPYTEEWTRIVPTQVVGNLSRFWVDLNRPKAKAAYLNPEDAWGLTVWKEKQEDRLIEMRLASHDQFYVSMRTLLSKKQQEYGHFVILDFHSYNHRRGGPDAPYDNPKLNPEINIGTGTMLDRQAWERIIKRFVQDMKAFNFQGRSLDIGENVKFQGGYFPEWVHKNFHNSGCVLSVEVKKFFMDEWTGEVNRTHLDLIKKMLSTTVPGILAELHEMNEESTPDNSAGYSVSGSPEMDRGLCNTF
jgi:N-formylglutamate deformylase